MLRKLFNNAVQASPLIGAAALGCYMSGGDVIHVTSYALFGFLGKLDFDNMYKNEMRGVSLSEPPPPINGIFQNLLSPDETDRQLKIMNGGGYSDTACCTDDFVGIGENLLQELPDDQLQFVMAHELAHYNQPWPLAAEYAEKTLKSATLFSAVLALAAPVHHNDLYLKVLPVFAMAWLSQHLLKNYFYHQAEFKCDKGAIERGVSPESGISFFKRLPDRNAELFASHPSRGKRIAALQELKHQF